MSILESIYAYMLDCPLLEPGEMGVNYLGSRPHAYTVDSVPVSSVVKRYLDGSSIRQFLFVFAGREIYGGEQEENLENAEFYEKLCGWLERQSRARSLPELGDGKRALSIKVLTGGYIMAAGTREARYQIQCRLDYHQKGER